MKIEIDDRSKIIGTFCVHERGVVSGLTKFIGRDVLVILLPSKASKRRIK